MQLLQLLPKSLSPLPLQPPFHPAQRYTGRYLVNPFWNLKHFLFLSILHGPPYGPFLPMMMQPGPQERSRWAGPLEQRGKLQCLSLLQPGNCNIAPIQSFAPCFRRSRKKWWKLNPAQTITAMRAEALRISSAPSIHAKPLVQNHLVSNANSSP